MKYKLAWSNIYLHYVLVEWFKHEVKPRLQGTTYEMRFTGEAVRCFQYREDSGEAMKLSAKRFAKYGLTLHPDKTRLVDFGRCPEEHSKRQGRKPATFDHLGCTHPAHTAKQKRFQEGFNPLILKKWRRGWDSNPR